MVLVENYRLIFLKESLDYSVTKSTRKLTFLKRANRISIRGFYFAYYRQGRREEIPETKTSPKI